MPRKKAVSEHKVERRYLYKGLGFPIYLISVPMIKIHGIWTPDIDYNVLQKEVLIALATRPFPLTGDQLQFIRKYFEMKLQNFASQFGITHAAIIKWENRRDRIAKILPSTEICIRLFILEKLDVPNKEFRSIFRSFDLSKIAEIQKRREKETRSDFLEGIYKQRRPDFRLAV